MRRDQFDRMVQAAHELLGMNSRGTAVDPLTLEWARQVITMKPSPPTPVAHRQQPIVAAMADHPIEGMLAGEICEASGLSTKCCAVTLSYMVKRKQLAMLKIPGRSRYFRDETALEQGRALVEAAEQRRAAAKVAPKPKARPAARMVAAKPTPRPPTTSPKAPRRRQPPTPGPREQAVYVEASLPPDVRIQRLAHGVDRRFTVEPPVHGLGLVAEWAMLTAKLRGRRK